MKNLDLAFWLSRPKYVIRDVVIRNYDIVRAVIWIAVVLLMTVLTYYIVFISETIKHNTVIGIITSCLFIGYVITDCIRALSVNLNNMLEYNKNLQTKFPRPLSLD